MELNSDILMRAAVDSRELEWIASPLPGVDRRMLERIGGEVALATSIVRYAPGSSFSAHTHGGGEEFIVLDGVFTDETGDFPEGSYVRNPPGSHHTPSSAPGCTIFVKLWQMPRDDQAFVRLNLFQKEGWQPGHAGEEVLTLHKTVHEQVDAVRWQAGMPAHQHIYRDGAEFFVVRGGFRDEQGSYGEGAWLRLPPGSEHTPMCEDGCLVYRKTGHLTKRPPPPGD